MERMNILGVQVSATNMPDAVAQIRTWVVSRTRTYVCVTGVHGVMECQNDRRLRDIHNGAGMVTPDGMPLVYVSRMGGHAETMRVYGPDLMAAICMESMATGFRHFFYGATPATLAKLSSRVSERFPGIRIAGTYAPPFRPLTADERSEVATRINESSPDIVWVGLSTPKQELWMADFRERLNAPVLIGVGAAFDFHAGTVRQAPRWMQPLCLEWLFRLMMEPRRLWKRYLVNNPRFLVSLSCQALGLREYEAEPHA